MNSSNKWRENSLHDERSEKNDLKDRSPIVVIMASIFFSFKWVKHVLCFII